MSLNQIIIIFYLFHVHYLFLQFVELCGLQPQVLAKDFETIEKLEHLTANLFRVEDCTPQIV